MIEHLQTHVRETLRWNLIYEMANKSLAEQYLKFLQREFPKLRMVTEVGEQGLGQILYLPKGRRKLKARFKEQLGSALCQADRMRVALATVS